MSVRSSWRSVTLPGSGNRGSVGQPCLGQDAVNMILDGANREGQPSGNLLVAEAIREERSDLALARRKRCDTRGGLAASRYAQDHHRQAEATRRTKIDGYART